MLRAQPLGSCTVLYLEECATEHSVTRGTDGTWAKPGSWLVTSDRASVRELMVKPLEIGATLDHCIRFYV